MKIRRRFLIALLASLMLHLGVISGPGWHLPVFDEPDESVVLDAHLKAPPKPAAQQRVASAPTKRRSPSKTASPAPEPAEPPKVSDGGTPALDPEDSAPAAPEAVAEPARAEDPPAAMPKEIALPRYARIRYDVLWGQGGFPIGQAVQLLRHDGATYHVTSTAETTGIIGLFRPAKMVNVSQGDVVEGGVRPRQFRVERSTGKNESAVLDWESGRVKGSGGREFALEPGTQDMLSMFCQLSLLPIDGPVVSLPVVTSKRVERYDFEVLGEEEIETPRGPRKTLHLRNRQPDGKEATEIWLGLEDSRLPVKIRHVDRRGDMFEQIAASIEYDDKTEGAH